MAVAAGIEKMQCDAIGGCKTGGAVVTEGFALLARYVIHAVGPRYRAGDPDQGGQLRSCYEAAFKLAGEMKLESVAFPLISSGIYG